MENKQEDGRKEYEKKNEEKRKEGGKRREENKEERRKRREGGSEDEENKKREEKRQRKRKYSPAADEQISEFDFGRADELKSVLAETSQKGILSAIAYIQNEYFKF